MRWVAIHLSGGNGRVEISSLATQDTPSSVSKARGEIPDALISMTHSDPAHRSLIPGGIRLAPYEYETHARKRALRRTGVRHECRKLKPNLLASLRLPMLRFVGSPGSRTLCMPRSLPRMLQASASRHSQCAVGVATPPGSSFHCDSVRAARLKRLSFRRQSREAIIWLAMVTPSTQQKKRKPQLGLVTLQAT